MRKFTVVLIFLFTIMLGGSVWTQAATLESATVSPYTGSTYKHNTKFANTTLLHGIDVSKYEATIDWQKVKAAGIDFAFVRVGYRGYGSAGTLVEDPYFATNMKNAFEAGVQLGVYIYSQATTIAEAEEEAQFVLSRLSGYLITMPVVMDVEYADGPKGRLYDAKLTKEAATEICLAFVNKVKTAGYTPMVYANTTMLNNSLNAETLAASTKMWLANYTTQTVYAGTYEFWQYSEKGTVDGISGAVDCNFWYKGAEQIPTVDTVTVPTVSGVRKSAATVNSLTLNWNKISSASGYEIYRSRSLDGTYTKIATINSADTNTYLNRGLSNGTAYYYKVRAFSNVQGKSYFGEYSTAVELVTSYMGTRAAYTMKKAYLRQYAKSSSKKLLTIRSKTYVNILGTTKDAKGANWYRVSYKSSGKTYYGYILKTNTKLYRYAKMKSKVTMRRKKSTKAKPVLAVKKNQKVTILSQTKTWTKISVTKRKNVYKGYVSTSKLK